MYAECAAELLSYAESIVRCRDGARDAVQESFLRYFAERSCGRPIASPRAWLYRVVHNYLLERLDTTAVKREVFAADSDEVPDRSHGPEAMLQQAQMAEQLTSLLTPRELECLRLRVDGCSYQEIGALLGIRSGTVSSLLTRMHKKLRKAGGGDLSRQPETLGALYFLSLAGGHYSP